MEYIHPPGSTTVVVAQSSFLTHWCSNTRCSRCLPMELVKTAPLEAVIFLKREVFKGKTSHLFISLPSLLSKDYNMR
jgi:hypothetical protein